MTAADDLAVLVIHKQALHATLEQRPGLVQEMAEIVAVRRVGLRAIQDLQAAPAGQKAEVQRSAGELVQRMLRFFGLQGARAPAGVENPAGGQRSRATRGAMESAASHADGPAWTDEDRASLRAAYRALEHPSFAARATELLGVPIEYGLKQLPAAWQSRVRRVSQSALEHALDVALKTLEPTPSRHPRRARRLHQVAVALTGAAGGALGFATLAVELPITTAILLRAIADLARAEGEDLRSPEARLACIEVFALGGPRRGDDAAETGYFAVRIALARELAKATEHLLQRGLAEPGAPALLRLITRVAQRFSVQVSEKIAAEAVPIVGAVGGATINLVFIAHFQAIARGHFVVRRLERKYGQASVRARYEALRTG